MRIFSLLFCVLTLAFFQQNCKSFKKKINRRVQDTTVYSIHDFSPLVFDSATLENFIQEDTSLNVYRDDIFEFYQRRNFQSAWFDRFHLSEHAYTMLAKLHEYRDLYHDSTLFSKQICALEDSVTTNSTFFKSNASKRVWMDFSLTSSFFKYADREYYGIDKSPHDLEWYIPRKKKDYLRLLQTLADSVADYHVYEPYNPYYVALKKALIQYKQIQDQGGFPSIRNILPIQKGARDKSYIPLKSYLRLTGDYSEMDSSETCTDSLIGAIKNFQTRMGLTASGKIDDRTMDAMNVPASVRLQTLMINLERLRWVPSEIPSNYLMVNIPDYKLYVIDSGKVSFTMNVVVGKQANNTAIFSDDLSWVVFSPYWNVPDGIFTKEMLPAIRRNPGYIQRNNLEVVSGNTVLNPYKINWKKIQTPLPFVVREKPGPKNSLGLIKFLFPNHFNIYMHDSPAKHLFSKDQRAYSHGCVRLAEPEKLAQYVFRKDTTITVDSIQTWMNSGVQKFVRVKPAIPVFIVYFTAWVNAAGQLNFRPDLYRRDEKLSQLIFGNTPPVDSSTDRTPRLP